MSFTFEVSKEKYGPKIKCDVSTNLVISNYPLIPDLFESRIVEVKSSGLGTNAGQGLYSKINIHQGQIIALYNGIRIKSSRNDTSSNQNNYDYRLKLNGDEDIDIPQCYIQLDQYCATLGHKTNHSFEPNSKWAFFSYTYIFCIEIFKLGKLFSYFCNMTFPAYDIQIIFRFSRLQHPRFGLICAIKAIKGITNVY